MVTRRTGNRRGNLTRVEREDHLVEVFRQTTLGENPEFATAVGVGCAADHSRQLDKIHPVIELLPSGLGILLGVEEHLAHGGSSRTRHRLRRGDLGFDDLDRRRRRRAAKIVEQQPDPSRSRTGLDGDHDFASAGWPPPPRPPGR